MIQTLNEMYSNYQGFLLDAYGVFWNGNVAGAFPEAKEAMSTLIAQAKTVGILSNATHTSAKEMEKLAKHGIKKDTHFHFMITSGDIARQMLQDCNLPFETPRRHYWVLGEPHPKFSSHHSLFDGSPYIETPHIEEADFIFPSIPHINGVDQTQAEFFTQAVEKAAASKLPMWCINPDKFAHEGHPPQQVVRQGSIAHLYKNCGGSVYFVGKPSKTSFACAIKEFERLGLNNLQDILMIGDNPETDIRGAIDFGMDSALVTETGIMADSIAKIGHELTLKAIQQHYPTYLIKSLCLKH